MTLWPIFLPKEFIEPPPLHSEHYAWRYWWAFSRWADHKMNVYIKMGFIRLVYTRAELFNNGPLTAWLLIGPENQISLQFQWRLGGFLESHESLVHIRKLKKHALWCQCRIGAGVSAMGQMDLLPSGNKNPWQGTSAVFSADLLLSEHHWKVLFILWETLPHQVILWKCPYSHPESHLSVDFSFTRH